MADSIPPTKAQKYKSMARREITNSSVWLSSLADVGKGHKVLRGKERAKADHKKSQRPSLV